MTKFELSLCPSCGQQTKAADTLCTTKETIMPLRAVVLPEPADGRDPMSAVPSIGCLA